MIKYKFTQNWEINISNYKTLTYTFEIDRGADSSVLVAVKSMGIIKIKCLNGKGLLIEYGQLNNNQLCFQ